MAMKSIMLAAALGIASLLASVDASQAQSAFRPGRDGGEFSGYETYRGLLDQIGLLRAEPERWHPLPDARQIMDQLTANGDIQDDVLKTAWEEIQTITDAIEAAYPNCETNGIEDILRQLRRLHRLGEDLRENWGRVARIRDGVIELYDADVDLFLEKVGNPADVRQVAHESVNRSDTVRLLAEASNAAGGSRAVLRTGALRMLGAFNAVYSVYEGSVMAYEAFLGYQRLPHILEKHEMIAYLGALNLQYTEIIDTINSMDHRVRDTIRRACPCLPSRLVPDGQDLDLNPHSDEFRINTLYRELDRLRNRPQSYRASSAGGIGLRIAEVERQIGELISRRTSLSASETANRSWYDQTEAGSQSRRAYEDYVARRHR